MENFFSFLVGLIILLIIFILIGFALNCTKEFLAKEYGVGIKTFNKWVKHFCPAINYSHWVSKRKLGIFTQMQIFASLGPLDKSMTLSKAQLLEKCGTHYRTLRENAVLCFMKEKFSEQAYLDMRIFPPKISSLLSTI